MTDKKIKLLVEKSYENNNLNQKTVEKIANILTRGDLKLYLKEIKKTEKKKNVIITLPSLPKKSDQKKIETLFPRKKIIYVIDPQLLVGLKIIDNDLVLDLSLRGTLESLKSYLTSNYD